MPKRSQKIKVIIEPSDETIDMVEFVEMVLNWEDEE